MTKPLFTNMGHAIETLDRFYAHCMETFQRKNRGYANTEISKDVLDNFRAEAADNEISMLKYARILRGKHEKAWRNYVNHGFAPDKLHRILKDRVNYALLEYLICLDNNLLEEADVLADVGEDN